MAKRYSSNDSWVELIGIFSRKKKNNGDQKPTVKMDRSLHGMPQRMVQRLIQRHVLCLTGCSLASSLSAAKVGEKARSTRRPSPQMGQQVSWRHVMAEPWGRQNWFGNFARTERISRVVRKNCKTASASISEAAKVPSNACHHQNRRTPCTVKTCRAGKIWTEYNFRRTAWLDAIHQMPQKAETIVQDQFPGLSTIQSREQPSPSKELPSSHSCQWYE